MDNGASSYRRFLKGDQDAFVEIVDLYRESLIFFLYRYVGEMETAEDLAEDVFVDVLVHPRRYHFRCSLKTWLFTIGHNKAVSYIRKHARITYMDPSEAGTWAEGGMMELPVQGQDQADLKTLEDVVLDSEEKRALSRAMGQLSEEYRTALHLVYFEDLSYEEAARVMGRNRKQIENLVYRGKKSLRKRLEEEGIFLEEQG